MNMDIFIFIKPLVNAQSLCPAADKCHRRLAGLLHYIAEIARKLDLAAAVEHCDLDITHRVQEEDNFVIEQEGGDDTEEETWDVEWPDEYWEEDFKDD